MSRASRVPTPSRRSLLHASASPPPPLRQRHRDDSTSRSATTGRRPVLTGIDMIDSAREGRRDHGRVRVRQDDDPAPDRRPVAPAVRARCASTGNRCATSKRDELFALRRRIGMLFQFGALFTDMTVFENVAFPMREHTDLADAADPRSRADEAARGRPARRGAAAAVGAVRRHGAPRRAGARGRARPDARDVRRAVCRPRPDFARRRRPADPQAQRRARHHVGGGHARRLRVAEDRRLPLFRLGGPDRRAGHARRSARIRPIRSCASSSTASRTARCRSTIRRGRTPKTCPPMPADALARWHAPHRRRNDQRDLADRLRRALFRRGPVRTRRPRSAGCS